MSLELIQSKLSSYASSTRQEELNALAEISQEIALAGLAKSDFFSRAAFQGGTCLRIIHGMQRFSEDLDFISTDKDTFRWEKYLQDVKDIFESFSLEVQIKDRSQTTAIVKRAFLKQDSFLSSLQLELLLFLKCSIFHLLTQLLISFPQDQELTRSSFVIFP